MNASALLEYFSPVTVWLEEQNRKTNETLGWPEFEWRPPIPEDYPEGLGKAFMAQNNGRRLMGSARFNMALCFNGSQCSKKKSTAIVENHLSCCWNMVVVIQREDSADAGVCSKTWGKEMLVLGGERYLISAERMRQAGWAL